MTSIILPNGGDGESAIIHPGYEPGNHYPSYPYSSGAPVTGAITANRVFYYPLLIFHSITISEYSVRLVTGIAGQNFRLAICRKAENSIYPGEVLSESGLIPTDSSGFKTVIDEIELEAGFHYWAIKTNTNNPSFTCLAASMSSQIYGFIGQLGGLEANPSNQGWQFNGTGASNINIAIPSNPTGLINGASTSAITPLFQFQVS
jgi:hypothetical protein